MHIYLEAWALKRVSWDRNTNHYTDYNQALGVNSFGGVVGGGGGVI